MLGGGGGDLDMGLAGMGDVDGMALEDLPPPMKDDGVPKDGEEEIDIWN